MRPKPYGAVRRHTSRRLSSWLVSRRTTHPQTKACPACKGTGSSGWYNARGELITCVSCRGWGY